MGIPIIQLDPTRLSDYIQIPSRVDVRSIYEVTEDLQLIERTIPKAYVKDYDRINGHLSYSWSHMDISQWVIFLAVDDQPIGGAMLMMPDCVLWDLRVSSRHQRLGVGRRLVQHLIEWIKEHSTAQRLTIETQNTNVPACRFYASIGASLGDIDREAYREIAEVKDEIRLNWYIDVKTSTNEKSGKNYDGASSEMPDTLVGNNC